MNWRIHRFPILASTNDLALEWMRCGHAQAGDVLVAETQTSGRGRPGRAWHSARGALLVTVVLPFRPERAGWTALTAGIAVARALGDVGAPAGVKWPNDVLLRDRKVAGILAETSVPGLVAVGIGLNVTNPLPEDPVIAARAARLADVAPGATVELVLDGILAHLSEGWELLFAHDLAPLRAAWEALDRTRGRRVQWSTTDAIGSAEGVDATGALLIRTDVGPLVTASVGEVTFL